MGALLFQSARPKQKVVRPGVLSMMRTAIVYFVSIISQHRDYPQARVKIKRQLLRAGFRATQQCDPVWYMTRGMVLEPPLTKAAAALVPIPEWNRDPEPLLRDWPGLPVFKMVSEQLANLNHVVELMVDNLMENLPLASAVKPEWCVSTRVAAKPEFRQPAQLGGSTGFRYAPSDVVSFGRSRLEDGQCLARLLEEKRKKKKVQGPLLRCLLTVSGPCRHAIMTCRGPTLQGLAR